MGNVTGLTYASGNTTCTLSAKGEFQYELIDNVAQPVAFSVAGIDLGVAIGKEVITPVDLVINGDINDISVINITTLLRILSVEPESSLNVELDQRLLDNSANFSWPQPDFSATNFASSTQMVQIIGDINSFLTTQKTIPLSQETGLFLQQRIFCAASGIYYGEMTGDDTGHIVFGINPIDGSMTTLGWSDSAQNIIFVQQSASPGYGAMGQWGNGAMIQFESGAALTGDNFEGTITNFVTADGTWNNAVAQTNGAFTTVQSERDFSAAHYFSAAYLALFPVFGPGPAGTYSFNLYEDGTVTGSQINIAFGDTRSTPITGTWDGNLMSATVDGGATITAFVDFDNMTIVGEWSDPNTFITSGGITGTGCQLND